MTACRRCQYFRYVFFQNVCIVNDEEVFDFFTGTIKKKFDMDRSMYTNEKGLIVYCKDKNKGNCVDFKEKEIEKEKNE